MRRLQPFTRHSQIFGLVEHRVSARVSVNMTLYAPSVEKKPHFKKQGELTCFFVYITLKNKSGEWQITCLGMQQVPNVQMQWLLWVHITATKAMSDNISVITSISGEDAEVLLVHLAEQNFVK